MTRILMPVILITSAALIGCSGGNGGVSGAGPVSCDSITGGSSTVSSTGPVSNPSSAADDDLFSFAALDITASSQTATVRTTAQAGVVFPAGSVASAFVTFRNQGSSNVTLIRTYLDGVLVETSQPTQTIWEPAHAGTGADFFLGFTTSTPFDAVEFSETDSGSSGDPDYRVYELCSDGHN